MLEQAPNEAARRLILDYLDRHPLAVLASASGAGSPQAALMGIAVAVDLSLVFDTVTTTRKYANLKSNPRVALVIGCEDEVTLQYEGEAEELAGEALAAGKAIYFARWPDGRERESWPDITYFRVTPRWIRHSDFSRPPPRITVLDCAP